MAQVMVCGEELVSGKQPNEAEAGNWFHTAPGFQQPNAMAMGWQNCMDNVHPMQGQQGMPPPPMPPPPMPPQQVQNEAWNQPPPQAAFNPFEPPPPDPNVNIISSSKYRYHYY